MQPFGLWFAGIKRKRVSAIAVDTFFNIKFGGSMLAIERKDDILAILQKEKRVLVSELSQKYSVTEETIRRDLDKLEKEGYVKKTYGGAVLKENTNEDIPFKVREKTNTVQKQKIAKMVVSMIEDGESIMLDSSSTSLIIAKNLKQFKDLTVITNSVEVLIELSNNKNINVISTGGILRDSALSLGGSDARRLLRKYNVDKAVLSCKGIHINKGITESNEGEAEMKRTMRECAKETIWAIDSSKFDKVSFVTFNELREGDIVVTERKISDMWESFFIEKNVKLLIG